MSALKTAEEHRRLRLNAKQLKGSMYLYSCGICDEKKLTKEDMQDSNTFKSGCSAFLCTDCSKVRDLSPELFDFFASLIQTKIQNAIDKHEHYNEHQPSY